VLASSKELYARCPLRCAKANVLCFRHLAPVKAGPVKAGPVKVGPVKVGPVKVGPAKVGPVKVGPAKVDLHKTDSTLAPAFHDPIN